MIARENYIREDGVVLIRTYSNENKYIRKVGTSEVYAEAIDIQNSNYEYVETDEVLEANENGQMP